MTSAKLKKYLGRLVSVVWRDAYQSSEMLSDSAPAWQPVVTYGRLVRVHRGSIFIVHEEIVSVGSRAFTVVPGAAVETILALRPARP